MTKPKKDKQDVLQRLAQASVEGLAISVAVNALLPGGGAVINTFSQTQNVKRAVRVMGKSAAEEGIKMLDEEPTEEETPLENLSGQVALEVLDHMNGRG